jgi:hypothetical protein
MENCRLIYKSRASTDVVSNETISHLVEQSAQANKAREITGLLLLAGNKYLQVLEGPYHDVNRLYGNIIRDARHCDVELITFEPMESRYFEQWNMRLVDLYELTKYPRELLSAKYQYREGVILIPDRIHEVYALLLDAKALCLTTPWQKKSSSRKTAE